MKQFLRYQLSGTVYLLWIVIFYIGTYVEYLDDLRKVLNEFLKTSKDSAFVVFGVAIAFPIGVIIHQFSVLLKNWVFSGKIFYWLFPEEFCNRIFPGKYNVFSDSPKKELSRLFEAEREKETTYILKRISNLNTFYYVRFDNGVLVPFLAWITISCGLDKKINWVWELSALTIGTLTAVYIFQIYSEINKYNNMLYPSLLPSPKVKLFEKIKNYFSI